MKKFLLAILLTSSAYLLNAQNIILNELYVNPSAGNQEYFELHNTSLALPGENLNCYTLVTYYSEGNERGFYVLDLPNVNVNPGGYYVGSSQMNYNFGDSSAMADYSWNDATWMAANGASTRKYVLNNNNSGYTVQTGNYTDIFRLSNSGNGNNGLYATFLFYNGNIVDVFLGAHPQSTLPNFISNLPDLPAGALACSSTPVDFSTLDNDATIVGNVPGPITEDKNYFRESNSRCGQWLRGNQNNDLTPGTANNSALAIDIETTFECNDLTFTYDITGAPAAALPVTVSLYYDINNDSMWTASDVLVGTHIDLGIGDPSFTFNVASGASLILVVDAAAVNGCSDAVIFFNCPIGGPLPVGLRDFKATKTSAGVSLVWETSSEFNNSGFEVLRKTTGGFESIGFVNSLAPSGTSSTGYRYTFNDNERSRVGVTYYRLRQVDRDNRSALSEIRSVRADGGAGILIYPNPGINPKVMLPTDAGKMDVTLLDNTGRIIQRWADIRETNLTLSNLQKGVYALRVNFLESNKQVVERIVIQ